MREVCSTPSALDGATVAAYRAANYRVLGPDGFVLRLDQASAALLALHTAHGVDCSAFVTACNPLGQLLGAAENAVRQRALRARLEAMGLAFLPAVGEDPDGRWPGEVSFLVFGLRRDEALRLGVELAQNALLWSGADAVPRLELLR